MHFILSFKLVCKMMFKVEIETYRLAAQGVLIIHTKAVYRYRLISISTLK